MGLGALPGHQPHALPTAMWVRGSVWEKRCWSCIPCSFVAWSPSKAGAAPGLCAGDVAPQGCPGGCWGQGTGGQRSWGLSCCPVAGGNGHGSANPAKWNLCVLPGEWAAVAGQERGCGQAAPGEATEHRHRHRCWAGSERLRLKPGERSQGSPWLSPGGRGSSPRGPPIAASTGCFFALARWPPAPLPCARAGLEWLLRSCEEQRELELARAASPPPQWALCAAGEAESNYRQRGGRAARTRLPKTPSPPAQGPPEGPQDPATLLCNALFCFTRGRNTPVVRSCWDVLASIPKRSTAGKAHPVFGAPHPCSPPRLVLRAATASTRWTPATRKPTPSSTTTSATRLTTTRGGGSRRASRGRRRTATPRATRGSPTTRPCPTAPPRSRAASSVPKPAGLPPPRPPATPPASPVPSTARPAAWLPAPEPPSLGFLLSFDI